MTKSFFPSVKFSLHAAFFSYVLLNMLSICASMSLPKLLKEISFQHLVLCLRQGQCLFICCFNIIFLYCCHDISMIARCIDNLSTTIFIIFPPVCRKDLAEECIISRYALTYIFVLCHLKERKRKYI
jgi:hypothetical protein